MNVSELSVIAGHGGGYNDIDGNGRNPDCCKFGDGRGAGDWDYHIKSGHFGNGFGGGNTNTVGCGNSPGGGYNADGSYNGGDGYSGGDGSKVWW